jgi:hypothetical protein
MYRKEYPIKCKSCNEQLACYSEKYEILAKEYRSEQALNMLNIMEPCSRYNMMNPTMILNIKENRNLIEGLEDIDVIDKFSGELSFRTCEYNAGNSDYTKIKKKLEIKSEKDLVPEKKLLSMNITRKQPVQKQTYLTSTTKPVIDQSRTSFNIINKVSPPSQKISILSPAKQLMAKSSVLFPSQQINPIEELTIKETDSEKIKESEKEKEFIYPTIPGIPTINQTGENVKVHISGKYYAEVLSGRTYICR